MHPHPSPLWLRRRARSPACPICAPSVHSTRWLRFKLRHYLSGMHKSASPSTPMWSTDSRRIDPSNLSGHAGLRRCARRDGLVTDAYGFLVGASPQRGRPDRAGTRRYNARRDPWTRSLQSELAGATGRRRGRARRQMQSIHRRPLPAHWQNSGLGIDGSSADNSPMNKLCYERADYSVVVKNRAPPPKAWRWEIYRAGNVNPINSP